MLLSYSSFYSTQLFQLKQRKWEMENSYQLCCEKKSFFVTSSTSLECISLNLEPKDNVQTRSIFSKFCKKIRQVIRSINGFNRCRPLNETRHFSIDQLPKHLVSSKVASTILYLGDWFKNVRHVVSYHLSIICTKFISLTEFCRWFSRSIESWYTLIIIEVINNNLNRSW